VLAAGESLRIQVFLDRSVVEVFVNERVTYTNRIYAEHTKRLGIDLFVEGGAAQLVCLDAWAIRSTWSGSETKIPATVR
jgi:beta-fructofuranosidase